MEIKLYIKEAEEIIEEYFRGKGYSLTTDEDTKPVEFQEEDCVFSIIAGLPING